MGNDISKQIYIGTIGELLVQSRLLEFGVQAAPPIKDSGNDLIAIKGEVVKFIQVKSSINQEPRIRDLPKVYHLICLVNLKQEGECFLFDKSKITVVDRNGKNLGLLNINLVKQIWTK